MSVDDALRRYEQYRNSHFELGKAIGSAYGGAIYPLDLLMFAAINRSLCLLKGFVTLIQARNFIAAAPLIRLQLDNCLRLFAATLVTDPHALSIKVLEGMPVRRMHDKSGKLMTDKHLADEFTRRHAWVRDLYEGTSAYVHLSEKHYFNAMKATGGDGKLTLKITDKDEFVPEDLYLEAIDAFLATTDALFEYVSGWVYTKNNPEKAAAELRAQIKSKEGAQSGVVPITPKERTSVGKAA